MKPLSHLVAVLLLPLAAAAPAQTVYRCGNSYSEQPCPEGSAVRADDSRTPQQQKAARDSARQERHTGDALEKQRLQAEGAAVRATQQAEAAEQAQRAAAQRRAEQKAAEEKRAARGGRHREPLYFTARDGEHKPAPKNGAR